MTLTRVSEQRAACRRAAVLARGLRRDVDVLLRQGAPASAADLRLTLRRIDVALGAGLRFDGRLDGELGYRQGHARNVALVLRRTVEELPGVDAARRAELLTRVMRSADDLVATVGWIGRRTEALDRPGPAQPWTATWSGRLLGLAARMLPAEARVDFVEDQCGNLAAAESRRERASYVLGLLTRAPGIAAAAARGRARW
jgi:hypothetical protein